MLIKSVVKCYVMIVKRTDLFIHVLIPLIFTDFFYYAFKYIPFLQSIANDTS